MQDTTMATESCPSKHWSRTGARQDRGKKVAQMTASATSAVGPLDCWSFLGSRQMVDAKVLHIPNLTM